MVDSDQKNDIGANVDIEQSSSLIKVPALSISPSAKKQKLDKLDSNERLVENNMISSQC